MRQFASSFGRLALLAAATLLSACAASAPPSETPVSETGTTEPKETPAPGSFEEQVALGQTLYGKHCSGCHGDSGEGTAGAPRVVGLKEGALPLNPPATAKSRKTKFRNAMDVALFVATEMPPQAPKSLTQDEYVAILAFDLKANGITLPEKLTLENSAGLDIPR